MVIKQVILIGQTSLSLAKHGANLVYACDISMAAVSNTKENAVENKLDNIFVLDGKASLAVLTVASDSKLMFRFLTQSRKHLKIDGRIITPQSNIHGGKNNPILAAKRLSHGANHLHKFFIGNKCFSILFHVIPQSV